MAIHMVQPLVYETLKFEVNHCDFRHEHQETQLIN